MSRAKHTTPQNITGRRIRALREGLGWSQERLGVAIGIDESSARARISRYELGVHEPPLPTLRLISNELGVPFAYLFCEDDHIAELLFRLAQLKPDDMKRRIERILKEIC